MGGLVLPRKWKLKIDKIVKEYIGRYGMKSQHMTCKKSSTIAAKSIKYICSKSSTLSVVYKIDLVE